MDKITKVGFYNPEQPYNPLETFRVECESKGKDKLSGSLIVLPEAFNIGTRYSCQNEDAVQKDPSIIGRLRKICDDFNIALVGGLIISNPTAHRNRPFNSAYLIDARGAGLLCHKMNCDSQGPYSICLDGCDEHNAILYQNVVLLSLICMDAYNTTGNEQRQKNLTKKLSRSSLLSPSAPRLLCIPAYIEKWQNAFIDIPNSYRIVANSAHAESPGSFIDRIDENRQTERLVGVDGDSPTCIKIECLK